MKKYVNTFKWTTLLSVESTPTSFKKVDYFRLLIFWGLLSGLYNPLFSQNCIEVETRNTSAGSNIYEAYCGGGNNYPGPEIRKFGQHIGGQYHVKLTNLTVDLDLFLVRNSDPTDCVASSTAGGTSDEEILVSNLPAGNYTLIIDGYNGVTGSYTYLACTPDYPDYTSISVSGPATASLGEGIQLNVEIKNIGNTSGNGSNGREAFWLADQPDFSGSIERYLGGTPTPSLAPNATEQQQPTFTIPSDITPGTYYIIHVVDGDQVITESDENNNRNSLQIEITNSPSLNCTNATPLQHLVKYQGNFTDASNLVTNYGRGGNFTGREILFRIDLPPALWFQGNVYFDFKGDAEKVILLNSCDPIEVFAGPYINKGTAQVISGVSAGTYYIVVEGPSDGSDGNFELTVRRDHLGCTAAQPITIGQSTGPGSTAYDYVNHYCGDPNATPLKGNEAIFELTNWPGGNFKATLSDMVKGFSGDAWNDAALILLTNCEDPATCVVSPAVNNGASELVLNAPNLPAGDYTIVVDGISPEPSPDFQLLINSTQVNPPFSGTIDIDPDIITPDDCTTFEGITYTGQGIRNMFDRRTGLFSDYNAYLFDATFSDGLSAEIQVNPEFGSPENARIEAEKYGLAIGQLPTALRRDVQTVWIHKGNEPFGGGNNNILIHTEQAAQYISQGILEETLVHEACHTSLDAAHANAPGWLAAQTSDGNFISNYAKDNPLREDIAESFVPYFAIRYRSDRIDASLKQTIEQTIPTRIAYFDNITLDMFPISPEPQNCKPAVVSNFCSSNSSTQLQCGVTVSFTPQINNISTHCGAAGYDGPERVYEISWEGGTLWARLEEKVPGQELILYSACDPASCLEVQPNELRRNLAAGTYYLVIDGKNGAKGRYKLSLNNADTPCLLPDFKALDINGPSCVPPGQTIQVEAIIGNEGRRTATSAELAVAIDRFYLFDKPFFSSSTDQASATELFSQPSVSPAPGQTVPVQATIPIPAGITPGDYYILIFTDADFKVKETIASGNQASYPISVGNTSGPDYLPVDFQGPSAANPNQAIEMVFKIKNQGDAAGIANGGKDKFYINTQNNLTSGNPIELMPGTPALTANIAAGQTFDVTGTVTIPANTTPGTYYILFHHDADNQVSECNESNNIVSHQIEVRTGSPDYIPLNFRLDGQTSLTVSRGQRISGSLLAQNQGNSAGGSYTEGKYYYSTDANFNAASDLYLGESNDIEPLAAGTGTPESENIKIPSNASLGTGYIFYWLDSEQRIPESNESNNVAYVQLNVTEAPTGLKADFTASNTNACTGTAITFSSTSTGSNTVLDQSPNEHDGTLINVTNPSVSGASGLGKALELSNPDDYVALRDLGGINNWTIETWFKPNRINIYENLFHTTQAAANNGVRVEMVPSNSSVRGDLYVLVSNSNASITYPIVNRGGNLSNEWHHLAIVGDKTNNKLYAYLDGVKVVDTNHTDWPTNFPKFVLGTGYSMASERNFNGSFDEFRVWNDVRTETEVIANKDRELIGNEAGLMAYYNFNQDLAGGNTAYTWSFPGGTPSSSTESKPTVTYANPGNYNVSLTINNDGQTSTEVKNRYMIINDCENGINVDFAADKTDICVGESVEFTSYVSEGNLNQVPDRSGNGNNGELKNFDEKIYTNHTGYDKALNFDGTDDYIDAGKIMPKSYTKEVWVNMSAGNGLPNNLISGNSSHAFWVPSGHVSAGHNGAWSTVRDDNPIATGWQHYAVTYDESSRIMKLFKNGVKIKEATNVAPMSPETEQVLVGSYSGGNLFKGILDEVRLWNKVRTEAEIALAWNNELTGNEAGLLVYYSFNQNVLNNLNYLWEFNGPNLSSSNEVNPTVTFSAPGTYHVSLTVSNGYTNKTETKNSYITVQGCQPDWPVTSTADYHIAIIPSNANITLEGSNIAVGDYIGAFYDDNGTLKCAGKAKWTGQNMSITIYGDDATTSIKDGFVVDESFKWKLWKASTNEEFYGTASYQVPSGIITHTGQFAVNGVSQINRLTGTAQPPQEVSQTITLQPGWNYISSYIKASQSDMSTIFNAIQSDIIIVKNGKGQVYMPSVPVNSIGDWNVVDGYQVKLNGNVVQELTISGEKADVSTTTISLSQGYNLFAYLRDNEQPVQVAMAPIAGEVNVITDEKGRAYIPELDINNIGNMKPGKGYWAKMKSAVDLNYNVRIATPPANMHTALITPNHYRISRKGSHHATMILDTKGLLAFGDEIGVFDTKGNLVGAATYEDHMLAFPIWGDDPTTDVVDGLEEGAGFEIRVWKKGSSTEAVYVFNANVDTYANHGVIQAELLLTTGTNTLLEANSLKLYPNPTRNDATLSLTLKVQATVEASLFDLAGKRLLNITQETMAAGKHEWTVNTASLSSGLYHCRILIDGVIHNIPFSVVK